MREGNRSGVSGGASLHGPMRRPRGVGRGLRWIVCSVIAGRLAGVPCVWASHTQGSLLVIRARLARQCRDHRPASMRVVERTTRAGDWRRSASAASQSWAWRAA